MNQVIGIILAVAVAGIAGSASRSSSASAAENDGTAERLYILNGGLGHSGNLNSWANMTVPPGTPVDISAYAYLIKHANGWMMFDTSTNDIISTMPNGYGTSAGAIRWTKTAAQTLPPQFKAIGVTPTDIKYIGISHSHADHTGNVHGFPNAIVLIQRREYDAAFSEGRSPTGPPAFAGEIFPRNHPVSLLDGDYDVFGDGSVMLFYVGGHTPGHQVALVRLPKTGAVLLSGDAVHLRSNWEFRRIPRLQRANEENQWATSVWAAFDRIDKLLSYYKAQLWIHHDVEEFKDKKFAPAYYD